MVARRLLDLSLRLDSRPTRFLLVGISGIGVNMAVLWLATRGGLAPFLAGLAASLLSTGTNFLLNDAFTWRDRRARGLRRTLGRMLRYYSATAVGNLIYLGVLTVLIQTVGLFYLVANLVAIGVGGTFNYLLHNVWTWRGGNRA